MKDEARTLAGIIDAERITGYHRGHIWKLYQAGQFPPPRYIRGRRVWFVDELTVWVEAQMAQPHQPKKSFKKLRTRSSALEVCRALIALNDSDIEGDESFVEIQRIVQMARDVVAQCQVPQ